MIVNVVMQPVMNDSVYWLPCDTEELYQKNLKDPEKKKQLEEFGWISTTIEYKFNSQGFRSREFDAPQPAILALGCSFTQGTALPYEQCWVHKLEQQINTPVYNAGIGGCSQDTCYRIAMNYVPILNLSAVVLVGPSKLRCELWHPNSPTANFYNLHDCNDVDDYLKSWVADQRNIDLHSAKNVDSIAYLCAMHGVDFYYFTDADFASGHKYKIDPYARDLLHFGHVAHSKFATLVSEKIQNKQVYCPHWLNRAQPPRA